MQWYHLAQGVFIFFYNCIHSCLSQFTGRIAVLSVGLYVCVHVFVSCVCGQSPSLSGILSVSAVVILATGILSLRWIYWQHAPLPPRPAL